MSTTKISPQSVRILERLHRRYRRPKIALIDQALKKFEDQILLDEINEGYARLKTDKKAWKAELKERKELDQTLSDGLDNAE